MDAEESITANGMQPKDDETKWNHKKRTKDCFLMFCEVVLQHEKELLSETLNSSQESINENLAPEGIKNESIENSTFNSDSDGGAIGEIAAYTNVAGGGEDGDSFNSVTCFCGKPFAGRPMIECSGCLTWLHMSCAKVKRKNIPEFYYCDSCKSNELLSPTSKMGTSTASSGEEATTPTISRNSQNGTLSSNNIINDGLFIAQNQNLSTASVKPRKPKLIKKNSSTSLMMSSSDNIKNNASDSKYLSKKSSSSNTNGKLKKMRQKLSPTTKKLRQTSPTKSPKAYGSSSLAAAASLTELSLNHQVSTITNLMIPNGIADSPSENFSSNLLKSPIATNNNNIYNNIETQGIVVDSENGTDKFNKRLKLL